MKLVVAAELKNYQNLLSDLIQKQIIMLGPSVALSQAKKVSGFSVTSNGEVTSISGNPQLVLSQVVNQYMNLSEVVASITLVSLSSKYPTIKIQTTFSPL